MPCHPHASRLGRPVGEGGRRARHDPAGRLFERQIFGGALEAEMDRQGRVLVPAYLREEMGIGSEALVIGVRDHGEIWAPDRWKTYRKAMDNPATFAEAIRGLGI